MTDSRPSLYLEIAESIRRMIALGELQPGQQLPTVRELAEQWRCATSTASRAYAKLTEEGLITGHRGGGTRVSEAALRADAPAWRFASLVNRADEYLLNALSNGHTTREAEAALSVAIARWTELQSHAPAVEDLSEHSANELRFVGSHDMVVEMLPRLLADEASGVTMTTEYVGSLGGLIALARYEADIAGIHLWDADSDLYNIPFVRRVLPGRKVVLIGLTQRALGMIVPRGNAQGLQQIADWVRPGVVIVNRQRGSGTRVWLDAQLEALGIAPESLHGYERTEATHLAVARTIAEGEADVGLGIKAAADAYSLGFVPLTHERYDLAVPADLRHAPSVESLVRVSRSSRFRETVASLGGYDPAIAGEEAYVD